MKPGDVEDRDDTDRRTGCGSDAVWCAEARDISLLHALFYIHSAGNLEMLINTIGAAQDSRVVGGTQLVCLKMAEALSSRIRYNCVVREIAQDGKTVQVRGEGFSVKGRRVIVAIPPTLAGRIRYSPLLHPMRDQLTQRMPMGITIKVQCVYPKPFWRAQGLAGQTTSDMGPVKVTFDNSPSDGHIGVLMGFIEGVDARKAVGWTAEQRRQEVVNCLVRYFGKEAQNPLQYIEMNWAAEEFTRGCFGGYFQTGGWLDYGPYLREPIGSLHWAGTETATVWNGYIEGALQSGERAAQEVLASI